MRLPSSLLKAFKRLLIGPPQHILVDAVIEHIPGQKLIAASPAADNRFRFITLLPEGARPAAQCMRAQQNF